VCARILTCRTWFEIVRKSVKDWEAIVLDMGALATWRTLADFVDATLSG